MGSRKNWSIIEKSKILYYGHRPTTVAMKQSFSNSITSTFSNFVNVQGACMPPLGNTPVQVVTPPPQPTIIAMDPWAKFLKGIKHVITAYKEFSDDKKWFD